MSNDAGGSLRFGIDQLLVRGPRIFGWGWIADRTRSIRDLHLVCGDERTRRRIAASIGLARGDVGRAFPDLPAPERSGFVVTGYLPEMLGGGLSLEVSFADGGAATIDLGPLAHLRERGRAGPNPLVRIARSLWRRLRTLDFSGVLANRLKRPDPSLDEEAPRRSLAAALRAAGTLRVIFDHGMGGGANEFRRHAVAAWLRAGDAVLLVTSHIATLDYRVQFLAPGAPPRKFRVSSFLTLEGLLQDAPLTELFVNSPVSFDEPLLFADWIARLRRDRPGTRLTVTLHDYFAVCPSFVLLNADGRHCGVPSLAECEGCIARHEAPFVAFSPPSRVDRWRESWGACLRAADEVRCFSNSSRKLLLRAYPELDRPTTTVVPHVVDAKALRIPRLRHDGPLVIGIVGQISAQKGAGIVAEMLARIERDGLDARIVVIGTLDAPIRSAHLEVTGPYAREALPDLIEAHGANVFLFPSIWAETFSYVVGELMAMRVPIVAFDLGAPAERLREYANARLVPEVSAAAALDAVAALHRSRALGRPVPA